MSSLPPLPPASLLANSLPTSLLSKLAQVDHLRGLLELVVRKEPALLPEFMPELLELQARCTVGKVDVVM